MMADLRLRGARRRRRERTAVARSGWSARSGWWGRSPRANPKLSDPAHLAHPPW